MCILAGFGVADYKAWKTLLVQLNTQGIVVCMILFCSYVGMCLLALQQL